MKSPSDDEIHWDQLVARAIMGPEFQWAWEPLKGSGIGSIEASSHVSNLIRGSRWHLERLHIQHETLMEAVQKFSAGQLNQATFECQLLGAFSLSCLQLHGDGHHVRVSPSSPGASASPRKKCWKNKSRWSIIN
jgi:hypothetical protein